MSHARRASVDPWASVQWPTRRAAEWARLLPEDANVEAVVAIGSAARGRARSTSDVDLIVVCKDLRKKVSAPPEVDARWIDIVKLQASAGSGDDVIAWGIAFGAPLYDPDKTWHHLVAEWQGRLPLPSPEVCAQRAERARRYAVDLVESGDDDAASEQVLTMLTHEARRTLCTQGVFPASRPELVEQLESIGASELAALLARAIEGTVAPREALKLVRRRPVPPATSVRR
jgi:predicted nucleotidyltransferase